MTEGWEGNDSATAHRFRQDKASTPTARSTFSGIKPLEMADRVVRIARPNRSRAEW